MTEMSVTLAANSHGGANGEITRVVIHDEEFAVGVTSAHAVAEFFSNASTGTSAHYVVDAASIEHCVAEDTVAYHAPPNAGSIGIEHDGFARFSAADWAQPGSAATLARSAQLTADICSRHGIPVVFLSVADLLAGERGITTHANVSAAWHQSDHVDPGDHFPVDAYLQQVLAHQSPPVLDPSPLLGVGSQGSQVRDVQHALNLLGNTLATDGIFGTKTQQVLEVFQQHRHLAVTGTTTSETWLALRLVAHPSRA